MQTDEELNKLAARFSIFFSRFEYALKATGCFKTFMGNAVQADWIKYAKNPLIVTLIDNPISDELRAALDYILNHPPQKQVVLNMQLVWVPGLSTEKVRSKIALGHVTRVRNNLFHGGKFKGGDWADRNRSLSLIQASMIILEHCL